MRGRRLSILRGLAGAALFAVVGCNQILGISPHQVADGGAQAGSGGKGTGGASGGSGGTGGHGGGAGGASGSGGIAGTAGVGGIGGAGGQGGGGHAGGGSSGGTVGTGGSAGAGGVKSTGGAGGVAGMGTGGTGTGGTATGGTGTGGVGTGGMGTGGVATGGVAGTGAGGVAGSGAATGGAGGAGGGPPLDISTIVPGFDGYYWEATCSGNLATSGRNCPFFPDGSTTCAPGATWDTRGEILNHSLSVAGVTGRQYTINFEVRGIVGTRCYTGGTIASTAVPSTTSPNNTWYIGGKQYGDSIWNTFEIHVNPAPSGAPSVYFANAFGTDTLNTSWCQKEATYEVDYMASIIVQGGGTIVFTIHDSNCQMQQNCGTDEGATICDMTQSIDLSDLSPPGAFAQPPTDSVSGKTFYPQWMYFDVKSVTSP